MKQSWTKGLNPEADKEMTLAFRASGALRERLVILLEKEIQATQHKGRGEELYSSPNWQLHQADTHGAIRAYEKIISLIKDN